MKTFLSFLIAFICFVVMITTPKADVRISACNDYIKLNKSKIEILYFETKFGFGQFEKCWCKRNP